MVVDDLGLLLLLVQKRKVLRKCKDKIYLVGNSTSSCININSNKCVFPIKIVCFVVFSHFFFLVLQIKNIKMSKIYTMEEKFKYGCRFNTFFLYVFYIVYWDDTLTSQNYNDNKIKIKNYFSFYFQLKCGSAIIKSLIQKKKKKINCELWFIQRIERRK